MDPLPELNLDNLCRGAVKDRFLHELERVLDNILDPNTEAEAKRQIKLTITFKPPEDRNVSAIRVEIGSDAKLAPMRAVTGHIFATRRRGKPAIARPGPPPHGDFT